MILNLFWLLTAKPPTNNDKNGECLITFVMEAKLCIVNGRVTLQYDGPTSISSKGKSVVDYILVSQNYLPNCIPCSVSTMNDVLQQYSLYNWIAGNSKPPDHSIVSVVNTMPHQHWKWTDILNILEKIQEL